jgi:hypothetical protein
MLTRISLSVIGEWPILSASDLFHHDEAAQIRLAWRVIVIPPFVPSAKTKDALLRKGLIG